MGQLVMFPLAWDVQELLALCSTDHNLRRGVAFIAKSRLDPDSEVGKGVDKARPYAFADLSQLGRALGPPLVNSAARPPYCTRPAFCRLRERCRRRRTTCAVLTALVRAVDATDMDFSGYCSRAVP